MSLDHNKGYEITFILSSFGTHKAILPLLFDFSNEGNTECDIVESQGMRIKMVISTKTDSEKSQHVEVNH